RQIVGAELAGKQPVKKSGFVARTAGSVEGSFVRRGQRTDFAADQLKRVFPGNGFVTIRIFSANHRMRDAAEAFQPKIGLTEHFGNRVLRENFRSQSPGGRFRGDGLGAVLAKLGELAFAIGIGPRTTRAIKAILLVELE